MFSGGIDSTGVIHQLFTNDQFIHAQLIVHHIYLQNRENRARAEKNAVQHILNYYQSAHPDRKFTYTESIFNTTGFAPLQAKRFPFDMDVCAFIAGNISVARKDVNYVAMGRTKTDVDGGGQNFQRRMSRAQQIFKSVFALEKEDPPAYVFPVVEFTKKEVWEQLPKTVQDYTWHCRHPQYDTKGNASPCGKCITCEDFKKVVNG